MTACLLALALLLGMMGAALGEQEALLESQEGSVPEQAEFLLTPAGEGAKVEPEAETEPEPEAETEPEPEAESEPEAEAEPEAEPEPVGEEPARGWQEIDGLRRFFGEDGLMATGWRKLDGVWYLFGEDGGMTTGWALVDGVWYYLDASGAMLTGWQRIGEKWYHMNAAGAMATGWRSIDGAWYWFGEYGPMVTGWRSIGGKWYWFNAAGAMATGWRQIDGRWYWFNGSGAMIAGWRQIDGRWYWFDGSGAMATGWRLIDGWWYWFDGSGAMATGWRQLGGRWYHLRAWGGMDSGWSWIDGRWYCLGGSGALYDGVTFETSSLRLGAGQSAQLKVSVPLKADGTPIDYTLTSSRTSVAKVRPDGSLEALGRGGAAITARAADGRSATCQVEVLRAPTSLRLSPSTLALTFDAQTGEGSTGRLTVALSSGAESDITFSGYDETVIRVAEDGLVTALGVGQTTVTAAAYNGVSARCAVVVTAPGEEPPTWRDSHPMNVTAHRGGCGHWPENTLEAFRNAPSTGADSIELDVRTTADGVEVIHHDQTFTTAQGVKYDIPRRTYAELKAAKPSLCTLDEALEVIASGGLKLVLEMKNNADAAQCLAAVKKYGLQDKTLYISFNTDRLTDLRRLDGSAPLGFICENLPSNLDSLIARLNLTNIMRRNTKLTQADIDRWHEKGILVGVWTVNDQNEMKRWYDMGVDYLTSDYPDRAVAVRNNN